MQPIPEQQKELQEKLKELSPEEIKELQKKQCLFCQIVSGSLPARIVYEDELALAVLDINPANPGHILLMPKEHHMVMPQLADNEIAKLFVLAKKLSHALLKATGAKGTNILVANGPAAGQKAPHLIIHVIPRKEDDGIDIDLPKKEAENQKELLGILAPSFNGLLEKTPDKIRLEDGKNETKNENKDQEKQKFDDISRILLGGGK